MLIKYHIKKTHVRACSMDVGEYVLRGMTQKERNRKLILRWRSPYRISRVLSDFLFEIEDLLTSEKATVHGARLRFSRKSISRPRRNVQNKWYFRPRNLGCRSMTSVLGQVPVREQGIPPAWPFGTDPFRLYLDTALGGYALLASLVPGRSMIGT